MKALLIAEKPSVMKSIQKVYNEKHPISDKLDFACFAGHFMTLQGPENYDEKYKQWDKVDLPIIPENFKYIPTKNNEESVRSLNTKIKNGGYDYIINACDSAREGELIFYSFYGAYNHKLPVKRFWASATTDEALIKALQNLIPETEIALINLQKSARLRAQMDWLYGINFTRAVTLASTSTIAVGRVMTPTLKLLVDREKEIRNFKPEDFYEVILELEKDGIKFNALRLVPEDYKDTRMFDKKEAEAALSKASKEVKVRRIKEEKETIYAPTLYSLLELQKDANRYFGYTASKTLELAQKLYEERKLLTYPRTESRYLPTTMVPEIPRHLEVIKSIPELKPYVDGLKQSEIKDVLSTKKYVNDAKIADHHALIVTQEKPDLSILTEDEKNIYILVAKKLLSIFLPPYIVSKTEVILSTQKEFYKANGKAEIQKGFSILYSENSKDSLLPVMAEKDIIPVLNSKLEAKKTKPPARYNDRTLLDAMQNSGKVLKIEEQREILKEAAGIGTPATRSGILDKLEKNLWMERKGKSIYTTDLGISVIEIVGENRDICSPSLTAIWEKKLREIEDNKFSGDFTKELNNYIENETQSILSETKEVKLENGSKNEPKVIGVCPLCGENIVVGKNFYLCMNYKKTCEFIVPKKHLGANITEADLKNMLAGKATKAKKVKFKDGQTTEKEFVIEKGKLSFVSKLVTTKSACKCPRCGKDVLETEKAYFCSNKECKIILPKVYFGHEITIAEMKDLFKGKNINMLLTNSEGDKKTVPVYYNGEKLLTIKEDITTEDKNNMTNVGSCPRCGSNVLSANDFYVCSGYPIECNFTIKKEIKGAQISEKEMEQMLNGQNSEIHTFKWKNGNSGKATIYLEKGDIKFTFVK